VIELTGRVVMVSGANRGIGRAIAERLGADGATLSLGARDPSTLDEVAATLSSERILRHGYDALVPGSDTDWIRHTVERFGRLDGLVNCAGILESHTLGDTTSIEPADEDVLDHMFAVNVKAPLRLTRLALSHLRTSGAGRIVNLSSLSGVRVANDEVGYAITKFGMTALSQATRRAGWDDGVRVTNVSPGFVATDMPLALDADLDMATAIQPEDLAELVSTVMRLPNTASVGQLNVACRYEPLP
jgi:NAD(P)-dependent dehydrogenase (short-subunit alcohol dehydrogenase family)